MTEGKEKKIPEPVIQYQENDWVFIKRLASCLNKVVVPDAKTGGVKYHFGLPNLEKKTISQSIPYRICKDLEEYEHKEANGLHISEEDCVHYIITVREIYEIGNRLKFLDKVLLVYRIESEMRGNELYHTYYLKSLQGLRVIRQYDYNLVGAGLEGNVKNVKADKVQVEVL